MKHFTKQLSILLAMGVFLFIATVVTAAPPTEQKPLEIKEMPAQQPTMQKPQGMQEMQKPNITPIPPKKIECPDIAITDMKITLVGTQLGQSGVEFPKDKVKVSVTVKNIGNAKLLSKPAPPAGGYILNQLNLDRNNESITGVSIPDLDPGKSWIYDKDDAFPHGLGTTYKAIAVSGAKECRTDNNEMSILVDEAKLHPTVAKPDLVPINTWPHFGEYGFCKLNNGKLEVTVKNQGEADAPLTTTKVVFSNGKSVAFPTSSIPKSGSAILLFDLPENCFSSSDCSFTITVDLYNVINESNEGNNSAHGRCYPYL